MNAALLLDHCDQVFEAPGAIARLRRFVLDLAVRGRLVPQESTDKPAPELLKQIEGERNGQSRRAIRRSKPHESIGDFPFDLPASWAWVPLGATGNVFSGNSINAETRAKLGKTRQGRPFIATKDVGYGLDELEYVNGLLVDPSEGQFKVARDKSVLICAEGGSAGRKIGLTRGEVCFGNKLLANETWSVVLPEYVRYVYMSDFFFANFSKEMTGVIGGISIGKFVQLPFPLPPFEEQQRIVSKVDELMALCDQLEAAREAHEATRGRLAASSLARLNTPVRAGLTDVRFAIEALPCITARGDQVKQIRRTILNLAAQGRLVDRVLGEGDASVLVESMLVDRKQLGRRAIDPDPSLEGFPIPSHWTWQSLDQILIDGPKNGLSPRTSERSDAPKAITLTATTSGVFKGQHFKRVEVSARELDGFWLDPGDLLFQRGNTPEYVGMAAIYDGPPKEFLFPDLIMRVRVSQRMSTRFVHLWCLAPFARMYLTSNATGAQKTMPKINQGTLRVMPIAIPPFGEQERIVAKVDALMRLCDQLQVSLSSAADSRRHLLDALLAETLQFGHQA